MTKPAIALRRREEALQKFSFKLEKLGELLDAGNVEQVPQNLRPTTFVGWEDAGLGVKKFSRNLLYETDQAYLVLHERMKILLNHLAKRRSEGSRKENRTTKLLERLAAAERKAQLYVNEYSAARAELEDKNKQLASLRLQLHRIREQNIKITHLHAVRLPSDDVD